MQLRVPRELNEEIFLDYGDEWEAAWQDHLSNWKPEPDADQYISADEMNRNNPEELKTEFEQLIDPYPPNVASHVAITPPWGPIRVRRRF